MKKIIIFIFYMFINIFFIYSSDNSRWVTADVGLRMREAPDLNSKKITTIPYNEEVIFLEETGDKFTISGVTGKWTKVKWEDKTGWVFGGFLSKTNPNLNSGKISENDLIGEWSYYNEYGGCITEVIFTKASVSFPRTVWEKGEWYIENNVIYITSYLDENEEGPGYSLEAIYEILDYKTDYLKVNIKWQTNMDTDTRTLELYKNAKPRITKYKEQIKIFDNILTSSLSLCFSPDDKYVLIASNDNSNKIELFNITNGELVKTYYGHTDYITCLIFLPDGKYFLSGSADKSVKLWDVKWGEIGTVANHSESITSICISPDGKYILTSSFDKSIKLWSIASVIDNYEKMLAETKGEYRSWSKINYINKINKLTNHEAGVSSVCFSPNGKYFVSGSSSVTYISETFENKRDYNSSLILWKFSSDSSKSLEYYSFDNKEDVTFVCFSPDDKYILSGGRTIKLWDTANKKLIREFVGNSNYIKSLCFLPDGKKYLSTDGENIILWDVSSGKIIKLFKNIGWDISISHDGKYLISSSNGVLILWSIELMLEK